MILIDIEMPKSCADCPLYDDNWDYPACYVTDETKGYNFKYREKRMSGCPLRDVKKWIEVENDLDYYPFMCPNCYHTSLCRLTHCPECGIQLI